MAVLKSVNAEKVGTWLTFAEEMKTARSISVIVIMLMAAIENHGQTISDNSVYRSSKTQSLKADLISRQYEVRRKQDELNRYVSEILKLLPSDERDKIVKEGTFKGKLNDLIKSAKQLGAIQAQIDAQK